MGSWCNAEKETQLSEVITTILVPMHGRMKSSLAARSRLSQPGSRKQPSACHMEAELSQRRARTIFATLESSQWNYATLVYRCRSTSRFHPSVRPQDEDCLSVISGQTIFAPNSFAISSQSVSERVVLASSRSFSFFFISSMKPNIAFSLSSMGTLYANLAALTCCKKVQKRHTMKPLFSDSALALSISRHFCHLAAVSALAFSHQAGILDVRLGSLIWDERRTAVSILARILAAIDFAVEKLESFLW